MDRQNIRKQVQKNAEFLRWLNKNALTTGWPTKLMIIMEI